MNEGGGSPRARDRRGATGSRGFFAVGTEQLIERRVAADRLSDGDVERSVRKCTPKRAVYWPRTKREVCYGALLPRVTTTTITTYCEHHLSILPYHPAGCPSADKGATERNRRSDRRGRGKVMLRRKRERESLPFVHAYRGPKFCPRVRATTWQ